MTNIELANTLEKLAQEVHSNLGKDFGKLSQYDIGYEEGYIASLQYVVELLKN